MAMKKTIMALMALGMLTGAATPCRLGAQQAEFYKTCMGIAQNDTLRL